MLAAADSSTDIYFTSKSAEYYIIGFSLFAILWGVMNAMLVSYKYHLLTKFCFLG